MDYWCKDYNKDLRRQSIVTSRTCTFAFGLHCKHAIARWKLECFHEQWLFKNTDKQPLLSNGHFL